jgi:hypothetical protein
MKPVTTITLAVVAGFLGGILSQRIVPQPVYAQAQTSIPQEIRAESFVIVDPNGVPRGAFGFDKKNGGPTLEITDTKGHAYWPRFFGNSSPLHWTENAKPLVVPPK